MNLLLDTNIWLWLQHSPERLGNALVYANDAGNSLFLSAVSSWEIAVKWQLGKLDLPEPPSTYVPGRMATSGVQALAVHHAHALRVSTLPPHHRDPFDRLLVAQALVEGVALITSDPAMRLYEAELIWAGV